MGSEWIHPSNKQVASFQPSFLKSDIFCNSLEQKPLQGNDPMPSQIHALPKSPGIQMKSICRCAAKPDSHCDIPLGRSCGLSHIVAAMLDFCSHGFFCCAKTNGIIKARETGTRNRCEKEEKEPSQWVPLRITRCGRITINNTMILSHPHRVCKKKRRKT